MEYRAACVLTYAAYLRYIKPLSDLGLTSFQVAHSEGLLTEREYKFISYQIGSDVIPSETEFHAITATQLDRLRKVAGV